jgi:hypothetical protein
MYNKALAWVSQFASGKIEYQPVRMLEPAYLRLHQFAERDLHIDTIAAFSNRYACNYRMRILQWGRRSVLGNGGGQSQAGQQKNERHC